MQRDQDQGLAGEIAEIIKHWNLPFFIEPSHTTGQTAIILNTIYIIYLIFMTQNLSYVQ